MMQRIEEFAARGQKKIHKLLCRLGMNQEGLETSSMETLRNLGEPRKMMLGGLSLMESMEPTLGSGKSGGPTEVPTTSMSGANLSVAP
jgi:hypothetical protein